MIEKKNDLLKTKKDMAESIVSEIKDFMKKLAKKDLRYCRIDASINVSSLL